MSDTAAASGGQPAGFWIRFVAWIINAILIAIVTIPINMVFATASDPTTGMPIAASPIASVISLVVVIAYFGLLEGGAKQASIGKMAMGLKVTDGSGGPVGFGKAALRAWPYYIGTIGLLLDSLAGTTPTLAGITGLAALISFIVIAFTPRKQGIHDMIAHTFVVKK